MEKLFIDSREGKKISVLIKLCENSSGVAFVMHGLSGTKEQETMEAATKAFLNNNISVVRFDARNTFGESEGDFADASITNYYQDLEDVIIWAKTQTFFKKPFWLFGSSLGGICTMLYAQKHPDEVKAIAPTSTVVSGKLSIQTTMYPPDVLKEWKRTGWLVKPSDSRPGVIKRIKWNEMEDRLKYDVLPEAHKLTMPVLLIVGSRDNGTPPEHQKILYDALPGEKQLHIIEGAPHTFRDQAHLSELTTILDAWIRKYI